MENQEANSFSAPDMDEEVWIAKRRKTTIIIYIYALLLGTEYSSIVLTLYFYLQETLKVDNISLYYSIAMASMSASASVTGLIFGRYIDKTRHIRKFLIIAISVIMLGNLLYTLHFSVWFIILGRLLCGMGEAVNTALSGNVFLYFSEECIVITVYAR